MIYARALIVAAVLGWSIVDPTMGLRVGALACAAVAASRLAGWRPTLTDYAVLALGLLATASILWTVSPDATLLAAQNYLGFAAVFLGTRAAIVDRSTLLIVAGGFLAGCMWAAVALLWAGGGLRPNFSEVETRLALDTVRGASANHLGYSLAAVAAVLVLVWVFIRPTRLVRLACIAALGMALVGVYQTGTRAAVLGLAMVGGWLLVYRFFPRRGWQALWLGLVAINLLILTGLADLALAKLSGPVSRDTGTLNGRLELWPEAREVFLDNPVLGSGAGTFPVMNPLGLHAHHAIFDLATGLGVAGAGLFVLIIYRGLVSETHESPKQVLVVGAFVAAVAPAASSGYWVVSPTLWGLLAVFSSIAVVDRAAHARPQEGFRRAKAGTTQSMSAMTPRSQETRAPLRSRRDTVERDLRSD